MDSGGWFLTIVGSVIAGIIILVVEYRYFQQKHQQNSQTVSGITVTGVWSTALHRAVHTFGQNYPYCSVRITKLEIRKEGLRHRALLEVNLLGFYAGGTQWQQYWYLKIAKNGDILAVSSDINDIFTLRLVR